MNPNTGKVDHPILISTEPPANTSTPISDKCKPNITLNSMGSGPQSMNLSNGYVTQPISSNISSQPTNNSGYVTHSMFNVSIHCIDIIVYS